MLDLPPIPKKLITIGDSRTSVSPTTKDQLAKAKMEADVATNKLYAAEAAHETAEKNKKVQTTATKVKETAARVQQTETAAHAADKTKTQALDRAPAEDHSKVIEAANKANKEHADAKDAHQAAKDAHAAAKKAVQGGGKRRKRRRTRKTRRKRKKSKHHRRRKRHTKKHRRSRRKRRSRRR